LEVDTGVVIRLVATDLDGTFWDEDLVVPPAHVAAVDELVKSGVTVIAATSRRPRIVRRQLTKVGLRLPAVLMDGVLGVDFRSNERFHQSLFEPKIALDTLEIFRQHELDPCIYVEDPEIDVVVSDTPSTCDAHLAYLGTVAGTADLQVTARTSEVYAFSVLGLSHERLESVARDVSRVEGPSVLLYPEPDYGEFGLIVNPPKVSKWTGVDAYCRLHGIASEEVLAVGDGLNDLPLLRHVGTAVGVRGGAPEATLHADHLIDPPAADGWVHIVDLVRG
jgi:hydroxymethylpyrimidine pyrophosphatase-like HAD family hydrolase